MIAIERAEVVVVVLLDAGRRQETVERLTVLVRGGRAAVKQQQLHCRVISNALRPHLERALRGLDRNHPHTTGPHVLASGIVEIRGHSLYWGSCMVRNEYHQGN